MWDIKYHERWHDWGLGCIWKSSGLCLWKVHQEWKSVPSCALLWSSLECQRQKGKNLWVVLWKIPGMYNLICSKDHSASKPVEGRLMHYLIEKGYCSQGFRIFTCIMLYCLLQSMNQFQVETVGNSDTIIDFLLHIMDWINLITSCWSNICAIILIEVRTSLPWKYCKVAI